MYSREEIEKELDEEFCHSRIECDAVPLTELKKLLSSGWVLYDTKVTEDANIKILTLAREPAREV